MESFDQVEFASDGSVNFLSLVAFCWKKEGNLRKLSGFVFRRFYSPDFQKVGHLFYFLVRKLVQEPVFINEGYAAASIKASRCAGVCFEEKHPRN